MYSSNCAHSYFDGFIIGHPEPGRNGLAVRFRADWLEHVSPFPTREDLMPADHAKAKSELDAKLRMMMRTGDGQREIMRLYKALHGIPEGTSVTEANGPLPSSLTYGKMIDAIIAHEFPE